MKFEIFRMRPQSATRWVAELSIWPDPDGTRPERSCDITVFVQATPDESIASVMEKVLAEARAALAASAQALQSADAASYFAQLDPTELI